MTTLSHRCLSVVIACVVAAPAISNAAVGYNAIQGMPAAHFDARDVELLEEAVVGVLEDASAEATRSWSNSKNGHSGKVSSLRAYHSDDGRPCKKVRIDNAAEGYKSSMKYDVCLHADGNWREAESGVPFGKATSHQGSP